MKVLLRQNFFSPTGALYYKGENDITEPIEHWPSTAIEVATGKAPVVKKVMASAPFSKKD